MHFLSQALASFTPARQTQIRRIRDGVARVAVKCRRMLLKKHMDAKQDFMISTVPFGETTQEVALGSERTKKSLMICSAKYVVFFGQEKKQGVLLVPVFVLADTTAEYILTALLQGFPLLGRLARGIPVIVVVDAFPSSGVFAEQQDALRLAFQILATHDECKPR